MELSLPADEQGRWYERKGQVWVWSGSWQETSEKGIEGNHVENTLLRSFEQGIEVRCRRNQSPKMPFAVSRASSAGMPFWEASQRQGFGNGCGAEPNWAAIIQRNLHPWANCSMAEVVFRTSKNRRVTLHRQFQWENHAHALKTTRRLSVPFPNSYVTMCIITCIIIRMITYIHTYAHIIYIYTSHTSSHSYTGWVYLHILKQNYSRAAPIWRGLTRLPILDPAWRRVQRLWDLNMLCGWPQVA